MLSVACVLMMTMVAAVVELPGVSSASTAKEYVIQISVYADHIGLLRWQQGRPPSDKTDIKDDLKKLVLESQDWFKSLETMDPPLKFRLEVTGVRVLKWYEFELKHKPNSYILESGENSLKQFGKWAHNQTKKVDLAILFTGYYLGGQTLGGGLHGKICTSQSAAIVVMSGRSPFAIAHEIGHVLGSFHDGVLFFSSSCPPHAKGGNVMSPTYKNFPHVVPFSNCSHNSIYHTVTSKQAKCLLEGHEGDEEKDKAIPALSKTADEVCRERKGEGWTMSRVKYQGVYGDTFCSKLYCNKGYADLFQTGKAPNGLKCGKSKRCYEGKCLESANGDPAMVDLCPWGSHRLQDVGLQRHFKSCRDACYGSYRYICCGQCAKEIKSGDNGM